MKKVINLVVLFAAGTLVLGSVAYGQTTLRANIPFAFHVGSHQLAAGRYSVVENPGNGMNGLVRLVNETTNASMATIASPKDVTLRGAARLSFLCQNGDCSLSQIRTASGAASYPPPHKAVHGNQPVSLVSISLTAIAGE